jgi:hypothetical protein
MSTGHNIAWERFEAIDKAYRDSLGVPFMEKTINHLALSPRIGVSFPVTERSKLYFNYGHFRSSVPYAEMYMYNYRYSKGQGLNTIGNPNLAPPRTISYELGGSYNLSNEYLITISGFYKDVTGEHTNVNIDGQSISDGYTGRTNNEYEDIQGLEVDLHKSVGKYVTGWVNFRYLLTKSGNVGREYIYEDPERNSDPNEIYYEADEDRPAPRPALAANLNFHVPEDLKIGTLGNALLSGWIVSGIFEWEKGEAFTHNPEQLRNVSNNLRWPDYWMLDMKLSKGFKLMGLQASFYVDIQNLLNLKVNWMSHEWCFRSDIDRNAYLNSLRLPMYEDEDYEGQMSPSNTYYFGGDDKVGDLRPEDVKYEPLVPNPDNDPEIAAANKERIKNKSYINNPSNRDLWLYGLPRDIWFGLSISF